MQRERGTRSRHSVTETRQVTADIELTLGRKHRPDYWLVIWGLCLLAVGLVVIYAISPALSQTNHVSGNYYLYRQAIAIFLSFIAFFVTYKVPLSVWRMYYKPILIFAGLGTLIALAMPVNPSYPAHRWVRLGNFSFQSVELVKFAGLIWLSSFLAKRIKQGTITQFHKTLKPLLFILAGVGVIIVGVQSDLGSAGVIIAMMGTMAYVAGLPLKRISIIVQIVLFGLILAVASTPYRRARFETYLHPQSNCSGSGYQACQALIAVGSGGFLGLGLGSSVQAYGYLPEADNDSIFAIYAEKFGFIGSTVLIFIFAAFFTRMKEIAERVPDDFTRLLVMGVLSWLSVQALINMGAMIGVLPLKGITLPFISYGGTSIVFTTAAVGLVFQASQYTSFKKRGSTEDLSDGGGRTNYSNRRLGRVDY
jgi:cell division protein FtsW